MSTSCIRVRFLSYLFLLVNMVLISSWDDLVKRFPQLKEREDEPRVAALKAYLFSGGMLRVEERGDSFRVVYPTKEIVDERIAKLSRERTFLLKELNKIKALDRDLSPVRLAFDPLYIKHNLKLIADRKYREAFAKLGFTRDHFLDPKARKIIEQFMDDLDYRKRVLQAIDESPVYRSRSFGETIVARKDARKTVVSARIQRIQHRIDEIDREITTLRLLKKWM